MEPLNVVVQNQDWQLIPGESGRATLSLFSIKKKIQQRGGERDSVRGRSLSFSDQVVAKENNIPNSTIKLET